MPYDEQGYFHRIGWSETGNASARRGKEFFDKYLKNIERLRKRGLV